VAVARNGTQLDAWSGVGVPGRDGVTPFALGRLPEIAELATFVAAAQTGSLSRAASLLHLSAPAVAKRLDKLETVLGRKLLLRSPRGVQLTPAGRLFYEPAERLLADAVALLGNTEPAVARQPSPEAVLAEVEDRLHRALVIVRAGQQPDEG
jgi:DNA-binding transcriptional LysR family regulator